MSKLKALNRASHEVSGDRRIPEPEPVHVHEDGDRNEYEATEMREDMLARLPPLTRVLTPGKFDDRWHAPIRKFWRHQIHISVPHVDCRDHLANERTFLGYLRTSLALSMIGVFVSQLWRLEHRENPSTVFGYFITSKPLASILQVSALGMVLLGAYRYWRQQNAMARGKIHAGGWEVWLVCGFMLLLLLGLLAMHVGIAAYKRMLHDF